MRFQWVCKHFKRCIRAARESWQTHVKPWQRPEAWERAVGDAWEPIDFREIAGVTRELARRGELKRLKEPMISITRKGAPTNKEVADMQERAKSFLEELGADALAENETRKVMSGASGTSSSPDAYFITLRSPTSYLSTLTFIKLISQHFAYTKLIFQHLA